MPLVRHYPMVKRKKAPESDKERSGTITLPNFRTNAYFFTYSIIPRLLAGAQEHLDT